MDLIYFLERQFGGRWCGVKFGGVNQRNSRRAARPMSFCQAVAQSGKWPIVLTKELMNCPGGSRSFGWGDQDEVFSKSMAEKSGMAADISRSIVTETPKLPGGVEQIIIGTRESPDVLISYAQPETAMKLLREWQRLHGNQIVIEISGFMSVCGSVAVKSYLNETVCLSFGCPDARRHASIGRDRLVVGLPARSVTGLWTSVAVSSAQGEDAHGRQRNLR